MFLNAYLERDAEILRRVRGKRILHLGCVGFTDCETAEKVRLARLSLHQQLSEVADCVGVDLDRESIDELHDRDVFTNVIFGDAENLEALPSSLGKFDAVVAGDIIEHLSNPGRMLNGVHTMLTPGGHLIISTPNSMGLPAYLRYIIGRFREGAQHVLCFNPITLEQLLQRHGFRVAEAYSCHQSRAKGIHFLSFGLGAALLKVFPKFGGTLLCVACSETAANRSA